MSIELSEEMSRFCNSKLYRYSIGSISSRRNSEKKRTKTVSTCGILATSQQNGRTIFEYVKPLPGVVSEC